MLSSSWIFAMLILPAALLAADGARTVRYSQTDIIPIHAKVRFSTLIVLPANEEILDFTTGDRDYWIINGAHNLCYVHPAATGIHSNLNLITASGHVYSFLLSEISNQPGLDADLKVFVVPKEDSGVASLSSQSQFVRQSEAEAYKQEAQAAEAQLTQAAQRAEAHAQEEITRYREQYPSKLQFDYTYKSNATKAPFLVTAIYHDDKFTYVKCGAQEKPTIYEIKDGKPNLVNFDFENGVYILPEIIDQGYLAVGKKKASFERKGKES
jgi:type IV secretion system protein VirB9